MSRWWRAEDTSIDHPKLLKLSDAMFRAWYTLNCVASANEGVLPPAADIAIRLRMKPAKVVEWITKLVAAGLYDNIDGVFAPHNWAKRQYLLKSGKVPEGSPVGAGRYVYFLSAPAAKNIVKIGFSKNPWARIIELQTSHPEKLSLVATFKTKEYSEADLHGMLAEFRKQGEWFDLPDYVMAAVNSAHEAKSDYASLIILLRSELRNSVRSSDVAGPRAEADTNSKQSTANASAPIHEDLKRKASALAAGVSAHFIGRHQAVPNLDRCLFWLTQGYAPGTVLQAVETVLKRGKAISTLDYFDGAIKDLHAKAAPENLQVVPPGVLVVEGTLEWTCWDRHLRETTGRGSPVKDYLIDGRSVRGWYRSTIVPDGYDEQTGERLGDVGEANVA